MFNIKPGAQIEGVHYYLIIAAYLYDFARRYAGYGPGTVTSGREGPDSGPASLSRRAGTGLHAQGWAVDVRTRDLPGGGGGQVAEELATWLRAALAFLLPIPGRKWDVVVESDHIHIELDWETSV